MNPHFGNAFTYRLVITEISFFRAVNTRLDPTGDLFVFQRVKPSVKNFGRVDRLHGELYQLGYTAVNPIQTAKQTRSGHTVAEALANAVKSRVFMFSGQRLKVAYKACAMCRLDQIAQKAIDA